MAHPKRTAPKVAVITRTKNRNLLLERALASVQSQTMRDFVQVVINDGDDKKAVEKLVSKYPKDNLLLIHCDEPMALTPKLNKGIKAIDSKYVAILDDDDTWAPDCLELAVKRLEETQAKGVVVIMDRVIEEIKNGKINFISSNRWMPDMEYVSLFMQCLDNYVATNCFIYERGAYDELGGYDEKLGVAEDWDFGLRFLQKYDVELLKTEKPLAFYHHRPQMTGEVGNSVFAGVEEHKYHLNMLANKYLREDLKKGVFGVGYIINSLRYDRERDGKERKRQLEDVVRLEGHMNHVGNELRAEISRQDLLGRLKNKVKKVTRR